MNRKIVILTQFCNTIHCIYIYEETIREYGDVSHIKANIYFFEVDKFRGKYGSLGMAEGLCIF